VPGWSIAAVNYNTSVSAGSDVSAAREITIGKFSPTISANLNAKLDATGKVVWVVPGYTFATPILGGQFALSMTAVPGRSTADLTGTLTASTGGLAVIRQDITNQGRDGFGDLYPQATLKWNSGVNNWMIYTEEDIPVGMYNKNSLANLGIGHGAVDGGIGYTYLNTTTGLEFSGVAGITYNLPNTATHYRNGLDFHLDWGASQFLNKQFFVGAVGFVYDQVTGDSGSGDHVGSFKSRVAAIGPQVGYIFPAGDWQGFVGLKGYGEFAAKHRPSGWDVMLTVSFGPAPPSQAKVQAPLN
jgi:hypothetical protein